MPKTLVNLIQKVNAASITNKMIDGDNHFVIPSTTLPDNIVMNGGLYLPEEIEKGYQSLEGVIAPLSHPKINHKYVSALDVRAINKFHAGAYVANVKREDGLVYHDTMINERVALQSEQGKKLVDAINAGDPIHTSTGVFLQQEMLDEPMTVNSGPSAGKEYSWIARDLHHDHQAILLNEEGAATPNDGVGMMVNSEGAEEDFKVLFCNLSSGSDFSGSANETRGKLRDAITKLINPNMLEDVWIYVEDFNSDTAIYEHHGNTLAIQYVITDGEVQLVGEPKETRARTIFEFNTKSENTSIFHKLAKMLGINVKLNESQEPHDNSKEADTMFKEKVIQALNGAGIKTEGLDDTTLFNKYDELLTANAVKPETTGLTAAMATEIAKIVTDTLATNKADEALVVKTEMVDNIILVNANYTEEHKAMLLNTPNEILQTFLPKPRAAVLGQGEQFNNTDQSDHDIDINALAEVK